MSRSIFQILIKVGCIAVLTLGCLVLFVAMFAYFFDSSLPGTSLFQGALGGKFTRLVMACIFGMAVSFVIYNKLPSFSDLFQKRY